MPKQKRFVFGYDPGGDGDHGVALVEVEKAGEHYKPIDLTLLETYTTVDETIAGCEAALGTNTIVASGIDTLTAWSGKSAGWRPADEWLRAKYKAVAASVDNPNHISGAMCINGALVLHWLADRLAKKKDKSNVITEAHPKVCFFALKNGAERHPWSTNKKPPVPAPKQDSKVWLLDQFGLPTNLVGRFGAGDHTFDALMGCLAAWRGLNRDWDGELHSFLGNTLVHPFGLTRYWWPPDAKK